MVIVSSQNYHKWRIEALKTLKIDRTEPFMLSRTQLIILHISPQTERKYDLTNKAESVMDLLVEHRVIEDDNAKVCPLILLVADHKTPQGYFDLEIYTQF